MDLGKVRLRVPATIRAGEVVRARAQVIHPMERIERDAQGRIIERNYNFITRVAATYGGAPVVTFDTTQSVSENPAFSFAFRAAQPGTLIVTVVDTTGARYQGATEVKFS